MWNFGGMGWRTDVQDVWPLLQVQTRLRTTTLAERTSSVRCRKIRSSDADFWKPEPGVKRPEEQPTCNAKLSAKRELWIRKGSDFEHQRCQYFVGFKDIGQKNVAVAAVR